jgi:hypothetical protein
MRRHALALLAIPIALLIAVAPVAADTFGAPGTYFYTSSTTCTTSGGMDTCTDVILNVTPDDTGAYVACLELVTYTTNGRGGGSLKSDETGCGPSGTLTVGKDLSVSLAATPVALESCTKQGVCTPTRTVTVSATDAPNGTLITTTTKSTETIDGCTTRTTVTEKSRDLVGTLTTDGVTADSFAFVQDFSVKASTNCR